jgi:hypothetical protein
MRQSGKTVILKIGTKAECMAAIDAVSGAPGIERIGFEPLQPKGAEDGSRLPQDQQ